MQQYVRQLDLERGPILLGGEVAALSTMPQPTAGCGWRTTRCPELDVVGAELVELRLPVRGDVDSLRRIGPARPRMSKPRPAAMSPSAIGSRSTDYFF